MASDALMGAERESRVWMGISEGREGTAVDSSRCEGGGRWQGTGTDFSFPVISSPNPPLFWREFEQIPREIGNVVRNFHNNYDLLSIIHQE